MIASFQRMSDAVTETITGDGYAVGSLDGLGEGYGFRKVRSGLGVTAFGVNALVFPPGYAAGPHFHDEQQELYIVFSGRMKMEFGDGTSHELGPGGMARVDAGTVRRALNGSDTEDLVFICVGGKEGYVGRDGRVPEGENARPDFTGPPGAV